MKEYNCIKRAYKNKLNKINKNSLNDSETGFNYFITYLRLLRDKIILSTSQVSLDTNYAVQTICGALNEYNLAVNCKDNYYTETGELKDLSMSESAQDKCYNDEVKVHLNYFWSLVSANISLWESYNDITI